MGVGPLRTGGEAAAMGLDRPSRRRRSWSGRRRCCSQGSVSGHSGCDLHECSFTVPRATELTATTAEIIGAEVSATITEA